VLSRLCTNSAVECRNHLHCDDDQGLFPIARLLGLITLLMGAQSKARGMASHFSARHDQAKKVYVPDAIVQCML